jgi:copper chaperone NosL
MIRTLRLVMAIAGTSWGLTACHGADAATDPVWGKQPCAHCAMVIGDRKYAAQLIAEDGTRAHFDDVGCMIAYVQSQKIVVQRSWVRAEDGDAWLDAARARYHAGARTPMDYGFGATATGNLGFEQVRQQVLARERKQP